MASFTSMLGLAAHASKPCFMVSSNSWMSASLRFSRPKSLDEKLRMNLWTAPVIVMMLFLAYYVASCVRVPNSEQLALLLEDEPVKLRIKGNNDRMPHKAGLEHGTVPMYSSNGSNKQKMMSVSTRRAYIRYNLSLFNFYI
jgi:hypothetical protein